MTMPSRARDAEDAPHALALTCYGRPWRAVAAALVVASRVGGAALLWHLLFVDDLPAVLLVPVALAMIVLPAACAAVLTRACAAVATIDRDTFVVARRDLRIEIPVHAILAVVPWPLPLPTPGASLRLRSGTRFAYDFGLAAPRRLATFLAHAGAATDTETRAAAFAHADAAAEARSFRWWPWVLKFPLLGLLPTAVFFRAHQWIAYGGTLGEYYTYGARAYAIDFLEHWSTVTVYLALWAGLWRVCGEVAAWGASRVMPRTTSIMRRTVEIGCRLLYYVGVPMLVAMRFLD